jgi:hypothetical protein
MVDATALQVHRFAAGSVSRTSKADLRPEFRSQSGEAIGPAPRADAAADSDDDKWVMGETIPAVHAGLFALRSQASSRHPPRRSRKASLSHADRYAQRAVKAR